MPNLLICSPALLGARWLAGLVWLLRCWWDCWVHRSRAPHRPIRRRWVFGLLRLATQKSRVSRCGAGICGIVVWLKDPIDPATGKPQIDDKNPNPALAKRPMIGLALFKGMHPSGPNRWSARSTTPTTARRTAATFQCTGRLHCGSKAASDRCAAAKPGRAPNAERDRFNRGSPSRRWLPRRNPRELHR